MGIGDGQLGRDTFRTDRFRLKDLTDQSKKLAFDLTAISTQTTRVLSMPDRNLDLGNPVFDSVVVNGIINSGAHTITVAGAAVNGLILNNTNQLAHFLMARGDISDTPDGVTLITQGSSGFNMMTDPGNNFVWIKQSIAKILTCDFSDSTALMTLNPDGDLTLAIGNLIIPNGGWIGPASEPMAIQIEGNGNVNVVHSLEVDGEATFGGSVEHLFSFHGITRMGDGGDDNYLRISPTGVESFIGLGGLILGHMYISGDVTVTIGDANPTEVSHLGTGDGWTVGELNGGVTFPSPGAEYYLTVPKIGRYEVVWNLSGHTAIGGGTVMHGGVMVNNVAIRNAGEDHATISNSTDVLGIGGVTVVDITSLTGTNAQISLWVADENSTDLVIEHGNIVVTQMAGT